MDISIILLEIIQFREFMPIDSILCVIIQFLYIFLYTLVV